MSENERLKEIRKSLELTQREFSDALDIKQGSYSDVERGKAGISAVLLKNLIRRFRINPLWLCEGEGAMFIDKPDEISKFSPNRISRNSGIPLQKSVDKNYLIELQEQVEQLELQQDNLENLKSIIEFLKKGE
ncbi:MAG: helix-turn-helix domain-containing protein [Bacteroidales bacterium]|nr:helix-turn-helix domain-containing protein [Bacteroidales bacterium]